MGKRKNRDQEKEIDGLTQKKKHKRTQDDPSQEVPDNNGVKQDEGKQKKKKQKRDKDGFSEIPSKENGIGTAQEVEQKRGSATAGHTSYSQHAELTTLPQNDIDTYLATNTITISPPCPLRPLISFNYLPELHGIHSKWAQSYSSPTPIQAAAWPLLLDGKDVIGVAETGSGKTLAFAVPCIQHIVRMKREQQYQGVMALIVSPTRELALQITEEMTRVAKSSSAKIVCLYGGVDKGEQRKSLKTANVIVATPGRLNDLASEGAANLSHVGYVVLDEADRMLDKGFEQDIRDIIQRTPATPNRQTMMFTATWPPSVQQLAATFMTSPIKITIGNNAEGHLRANTSILQKVEVVDPRRKEQRMLELLKQYQTGNKSNDRILLFCLYKKEATRVEQFIRSRGFRVAGIHGDMSQSQRIASLEAFRSGTVPLLVATDVAARGLDIPEVKVVINLTFPLTVDDYVHRIGRTGRAGKQGLAITLFTEHDKAQSGALINVLKGASQEVPEALLKFGTTVKKKDHEAYGAFYKDTNGAKAATKIKFDD